MKIKQVCEITGLTDKTIRFYIDNKLITPHCTENHLGRRSFTFNEENLKELDDIATLRKAGFSVVQIKEIQRHKENSKEIIAEIMAFKERQIEENKLINAALSQLESDRAYSVREIAEVLRESGKDKEVLQDEDDIWYILIKWIKLIMIVLWLLSGIAGFVEASKSVSAAVENYSPLTAVLSVKRLILIWCIILSPIIIFLISVLVKQIKNIKSFSLTHNVIVVSILTVSLLFALPLLPGMLGVFHGLDYGAETSSPEDYFIITNTTNEDDRFYKVFPSQIPAYVMQNYYLCNHKKECECKKPEYYYTNYLDWDVEVYEMYAEWVLDEEAFEEEVDRIYSIGGIERTYEDYTVRFFEYEKDWRGKYCLAFAYNKETKTVRYIYYGGYNPEGKKPYCETVEWMI